MSDQEGTPIKDWKEAHNPDEPPLVWLFFALGLIGWGAFNGLHWGDWTAAGWACAVGLLPALRFGRWVWLFWKFHGGNR